MYEFIDRYLELNKKDNSGAARFALQELWKDFDLRSNYSGLLVSEDCKCGYNPLENLGKGIFYIINSGRTNMRYLLKGDSFIILEKNNGELREIRTKEKINLILNNERRPPNCKQKELIEMYERLLEGKDI